MTSVRSRTRGTAADKGQEQERIFRHHGGAISRATTQTLDHEMKCRDGIDSKSLPISALGAADCRNKIDVPLSAGLRRHFNKDKAFPLPRRIVEVVLEGRQIVAVPKRKSAACTISDRNGEMPECSRTDGPLISAAGMFAPVRRIDADLLRCVTFLTRRAVKNDRQGRKAEQSACSGRRASKTKCVVPPMLRNVTGESAGRREGLVP